MFGRRRGAGIGCYVAVFLIMLLFLGGWYVVNTYRLTGSNSQGTNPIVVDAPGGITNDLPVVVDGQKATWHVAELTTAFWWNSTVGKIIQYQGKEYTVISVKGDNPPTVTVKSD